MLSQDSETQSLHLKVLIFSQFSKAEPFHHQCMFWKTNFERFPIFYQNKLQFVDQFTRKTFPWYIKAPCKAEKSDQQISLNLDDDESYSLKPYRITARNLVKNFTTDEIQSRFTQVEFIAQQLGIYSQRDWTNSIVRVKFNQLVDDAAKKFEVAQAVNFAYHANEAKLQAQFSQLQSRYNNYFNKLFVNGKEFTLRVSIGVI